MVCSSLLVSFATAAVAISANTEPTNLPREADKRPLVNSKALQASIERSALEQKGHELENAAYSTPDRNRVFSSPGHENTLDFISGYLDTVADYYTYTRQPFEALYSQASGNFSADGTDYEPSIFQYSASGSVTAPIVAVANLGCNATDYPAEVAGNVALSVISRYIYCCFTNILKNLEGHMRIWPQIGTGGRSRRGSLNNIQQRSRRIPCRYSRSTT